MPFHAPRARDHDIPDLARENVCALGPSARDVLEEERLQPKSRGVAAGSAALCTLKLGRCRIAPAIPEGVVLARTHPSRASALRPLFHAPRGDCLRRHSVFADSITLSRPVNIAPPRARGSHLRAAVDGVDTASKSSARDGDAARKSCRANPYLAAAGAPVIGELAMRQRR